MNDNQHPQVERYLKRATRGLWGKKRAEVREELEAHLRDRVLAHRIAGMREDDAVEKTLLELGNPHTVSRGMISLYTMPTLVGSGLIAAVMAVMITAVVTTTTLAQQIPVTFRVPTVPCLAVEAGAVPKECVTPLPWVHLPSLREHLAPLGVEITHGPVRVELLFPGGKHVSLSLLDNVVGQRDEQGIPVPAEEVSHEYIDLWRLLTIVGEKSGLPIRIEGWINPRVHVGDTSFGVGTAQGEVNPYDLYTQGLHDLMFSRLHAKTDAWNGMVFSAQYLSQQEEPFPGHQVHVNDTPGTTYGVISRAQLPAEFRSVLADQPVEFVFITDVAPVAQDGSVSLQLPWEDVTFVGSIQELMEAEPEERKAVLLRLSGTFNTSGMEHEVVGPRSR